jgi:molybdopterin synthase sulfur carrier subunit
MKKNITVRYFAGFREHAGVSEEEVSLAVSNAGDVFESLKHRHGSEEPLGHCKVAVNDEMADWDAVVNDGDIVLFFPPVAGG